MSRRRKMMAQQFKKKLPSDYTELKYIIATGYQWIDTGVYAENEYTGARYKYSIAQKKAYGPYTLSGSGFYCFPLFRSHSGDNIAIQRTDNDGLQISNFTYSINTPYEFFVDEKGDVYLDNEFIVSIGNDPLEKSPYAATIKIGTYYGELGSQQYSLVGNLYFVQIFQNGKIVRDFVPCINPEGIAGLYDLAEGGFYKSATTTNYQAGEVV